MKKRVKSAFFTVCAEGPRPRDDQIVAADQPVVERAEHWHVFFLFIRGSIGSVEAVETDSATGENAALGLRRGALQPLADHVRRAGEEAVGVRVVGRPQDFVWTDIIGQHPQVALDRLERDPAIALKKLARARLETGIVKALVVEMPVHDGIASFDEFAWRLLGAQMLFRGMTTSRRYDNLNPVPS